MDRNEAIAALESVAQAEGRLAETATWPLWRHAVFALAEAVLVFAVSLPFVGLLAGFALSIAIAAWTVNDDKQRYGMFVSGWRAGKPGVLLVIITAFVVAMAFLSFTARDDAAPALTPALAAMATFAVCTAGSVLWQRLYQQQLRGKAGK